MYIKPAKKHLVVIGGGTGTHTVLRGLKRYTDRITITAIISMADSGGSTGRLRDQFGLLPVGDVRMALSALARDAEWHEELLRELFLYRFKKGDGLQGHNFGNLFLTALTDLLGSEAMAVEAASQILRIHGRVLPVTADNVHLIATYDDGVVISGESQIDEPSQDRYPHRIVSLGTVPVGTITPDADVAIRQADLIVLGPGDLYASMLANLVIGGVADAIRESRGTFVVVMSLMERPGQTQGMSMRETIIEIQKYAGRIPDIVCINDAPLPAEVIARYAEEGSKPLCDDMDDFNGVRVIRRDLLFRDPIEQQPHDTVTRSLIRHDSDRLAMALLELVE